MNFLFTIGVFILRAVLQVKEVIEWVDFADFLIKLGDSETLNLLAPALANAANWNILGWVVAIFLFFGRKREESPPRAVPPVINVTLTCGHDREKPPRPLDRRRRRRRKRGRRRR